MTSQHGLLRELKTRLTAHTRLRQFRLSSSGEVLRNFSYLAIGGVGTKAMGFLVTLLIARRIGTAGFGQINFAQAFLAYFLLIADFGVSLTGTRYVASQSENLRKSVGDFLGVRFVLGAVATVMFLGVLAVINRPLQDKLLIALFGLLIPGVTFSLDWVYRGIEKMEWIAVSNLIRVAIPLSLVLFLIENDDQLLLIPVFFVLGAMGQIAFYWHRFTRHTGWPAITFEPSHIKQLLLQVSTLGAATIMIQIYYNIDTLLLGLYRTNTEVGLYSAAYRVVLAFTGVAGLLGNAVFPRLSRLTHTLDTNENRLGEIMSLGARLLIYLALPIALTGSVFSRQLISVLYGPDYVQSANVLSILIWQVFTVFANVAFAFNLLAANQDKPYFYSVSAGAVVNLALNLLLIPRFGMMSAAVATVVAEIVVLVMLYRYAYRLVAPVPMIVPLLKAIFAAAMFLLVVYLVQNTILQFVLGNLAYVAALAITRPFSLDEYRFILPWRTE